MPRRNKDNGEQMSFEDDEWAWFGARFRDPLYRGKLEQAFWEYHHANFFVYHMLVKYAREWKRAGHNRCSIQLLFERARWQLALRPDRHGIKLNNNHCAFYARLIELREADLVDFFKKRQQRIQASFGPLNETLQPGDHIS